MDDEIASELAAALQNLLGQTNQIKGLFTDEDGAIADAVTELKMLLIVTGSKSVPSRYPISPNDL